MRFVKTLVAVATVATTVLDGVMAVPAGKPITMCTSGPENQSEVCTKTFITGAHGQTNKHVHHSLTSTGVSTVIPISDLHHPTPTDAPAIELAATSYPVETGIGGGVFTVVPISDPDHGVPAIPSSGYTGPGEPDFPDPSTSASDTSSAATALVDKRATVDVTDSLATTALIKVSARDGVFDKRQLLPGNGVNTGISARQMLPITSINPDISQRQILPTTTVNPDMSRRQILPITSVGPDITARQMLPITSSSPDISARQIISARQMLPITSVSPEISQRQMLPITSSSPDISARQIISARQMLPITSVSPDIAARQMLPITSSSPDISARQIISARQLLPITSVSPEISQRQLLPITSDNPGIAQRQLLPITSVNPGIAQRQLLPITSVSPDISQRQLLPITSVSPGIAERQLLPISSVNPGIAQRQLLPITSANPDISARQILPIGSSTSGVGALATVLAHINEQPVTEPTATEPIAFTFSAVTYPIGYDGPTQVTSSAPSTVTVTETTMITPPVSSKPTLPHTSWRIPVPMNSTVSSSSSDTVTITINDSYSLSHSSVSSSSGDIVTITIADSHSSTVSKAADPVTVTLTTTLSAKPSLDIPLPLTSGREPSPTGSIVQPPKASTTTVTAGHSSNLDDYVSLPYSTVVPEPTTTTSTSTHVNSVHQSKQNSLPVEPTTSDMAAYYPAPGVANNNKARSKPIETDTPADYSTPDMASPSYTTTFTTVKMSCDHASCSPTTETVTATVDDEEGSTHSGPPRATAPSAGISLPWEIPPHQRPTPTAAGGGPIITTASTSGCTGASATLPRFTPTTLETSVVSA
ncbi:hypothetical protein diail_9006 [Diaporthe ilicicola]|nr:hypothetical protein diail_9006 [Diaporthe ilicicola]